MKGKIFTPDEANRMLPLVSRIADDIVATYTRVQKTLEDLEAVKTIEDDETREARERRLEVESARLLDRFQTLIEEIEELGGTVKDYERGCIDFYGELDSEIVYLCWHRGEDAISHWHRLDEGFSARRAISIASAA